jgi:hypothetical protein
VVSLTGGALGIFHGVSPLIWKPPTPVPENVEIVLDRSKGMAQLFEGKSKLEAAVHAIELTLNNDGLAQSNLAYREFGGPCDESDVQTEPTLPFKQKNAGQIRSKTRELISKRDGELIKPTGEASLVGALQQAIGDFSDLARFRGVSKRIVVITGSTDACRMSLERVRRRLASLREGDAKSTIELDFKFIAVGVDKSGEAQLKAIADETKGTLHFVYNQQQLDDTFHDIIVDEPAERAANALRDILDAGVHRLDLVSDDLDKKDYAAGEGHLRQAWDEFSRSELPFQFLGKQLTDEKYLRIYEAARKQRELQGRLIALSEGTLSQATAPDADALSASRAEYKKLIADYNKGANDFQDQLGQLRSQAPAR